jgi:mannose-6-phosphate isomerase-like protein (cupin superfamily)
MAGYASLNPPYRFIIRKELSLEVVNRKNAAPFTTKDKSEIRDILSPRNSSIRNQSLAEARVLPGMSTEDHIHPKAEEIYYILKGKGRIRIEGEERDIRPGDAIALQPGKRHKIWNTGTTDLIFLCCCAPAYTHEDTVITE